MKTADPELMRAINRFHVIDIIRRQAPIARVEIADRTDLSRATVSAITGALIEDGLVNAVHVGPTDNGARGRPRVLLELNGAAYHVAGVTLSADRLCVAITDFKGASLAVQVHEGVLVGLTPEAIAARICDAVLACLATSGRALPDISAIGIGLPGIIDGVSGLCHWSPVLGPEPTPFAALVEARLGIRTVIENEANLVAMAEHWFGQGRFLRSFAVVTVNDMLGLAMMIDGRLYRGAQGIGMEFGHTKLSAGGLLCRCGQHGCLDSVASDAGLVDQARAIGALDARVCDGQPLSSLTMRALAGDATLEALFHRAGAALGLGIANVINLLNPQRLIVSGAGLRARALIEQPLLAAAAATLPQLRGTTEIVFHPWTDEMLALGAASIVLRQIDEAPWAVHAGR